MDFKKYEVLIRALECGSLTRAGEYMGYTQSGVSHMMKGLEEEIGFRILTRGRGGVALTEEGEKIIPMIREMIRQNDRLEQTISSIKGCDTGRIRIASIAGIACRWLPGIISIFMKDFPNIDIEIMEGGAREINKWMEDGAADISFQSISELNCCDSIPLKKDRFMAVLPLDGEGARPKPPVPIEYFNKRTFISLTRGIDYEIHNLLVKHKVSPVIKFSSTDDNTIISMVENGLGVSILPELMLEGNEGRVRCLPITPQIYRVLGMGVPYVDDISPASVKFMRCVTSLLKNDMPDASG